MIVSDGTLATSKLGGATTPSVALIVLSFNHARYLFQLFASIEANWAAIHELLFIDNGSSDDGASQMREFLESCPGHVKSRLFVNQRGTGVAKAVNQALRSATSEFVAVTAADDFLLVGRFTSQLALMRANPSLQFCFANGYVCDDAGNISVTPVHGPSMVALLMRPAAEVAENLFYPVPALFTQCALFRREALLDIGGWDEDLVIDDWPLNLKLFRRFAEGHQFIPDFVCAYRRHGTNASKRRFRQYNGQKQVLLKYAQGSDLRNGLFALFATQVLASLKRRQWIRARLFLHVALGQRPDVRFILQWIHHEIGKRFASNRIH